MWKIANTREDNQKAVDLFCVAGYEPFAVTVDILGNNIIWFRKEEDEVSDQSTRPIKRRSRATADAQER